MKKGYDTCMLIPSPCFVPTPLAPGRRVSLETTWGKLAWKLCLFNFVVVSHHSTSCLSVRDSWFRADETLSKRCDDAVVRQMTGMSFTS